MGQCEIPGPRMVKRIAADPDDLCAIGLRPLQGIIRGAGVNNNELGRPGKRLPAYALKTRLENLPPV